MQKINQESQKITKILENISKEISLLNEKNKEDLNNFEIIKNKIGIIRKELTKIEEIFNINSKSESPVPMYVDFFEEEDLFNIKIKKQIKIKKGKNSKSFFSWMFNNLDL